MIRHQELAEVIKKSKPIVYGALFFVSYTV